LIGEEATARAGWIGSVLGGEGTGAVHKVPRIDYRCWWNSVNDSTEFEEEVGFSVAWSEGMQLKYNS
jgi:hypothetical protein